MSSDSASYAPELTGKNAVVTGASRGIGAAISRAFAAAGARVVLVGRNRDTLEEVAAGLPHEPVVVTADLAAADAPATVMERVRQTVGSVDVLVNNAGGGSGAGSAHTLTEQDADAGWALYLRAPILLSGLAAADMAEHGGGSIVNISSGLGQQGMPGLSLYSGLRGGIEAATRSLAAEWGAQQVRVNVVSPGATRTVLGSWIAGDEEVTRRYLEKVPLDRIGEPEDIAAAVLFLSSPQSAYVTGQTLAVDGGWTTTAPSPLRTA
ncbi:SDR family oxidoreductase [Streptomyces sp. NBC_01476]|uniref:SDR family NAD(P)-dependent oxidoreductase n=1 Tax=Streptomyces sp. NBC_01476 TaxID=2903881 RepID=UPI002E2EE4B3|nr:SDR family oxidoreductase [Streptomyces sp. NBC_01476]